MVITKNDQMLLPSALSAMVLVMLVLLMMEYLLRGISPLLIYPRLCPAPPVLPAVPDNVQNNTTTWYSAFSVCTAMELCYTTFHDFSSHHLHTGIVGKGGGNGGEAEV